MSNNEDVYILGIDVARGGERRDSTNGDDSAMTTFHLKGLSKCRMVNAYRVNGAEARQISGKIHDLDKKFNYSLIVCDHDAFALAIKDELARTTQHIGDRTFDVTPITTFEPSDMGIGNSKLVLFSRGDFLIKQICGRLSSESMLTNKAHQLLRAAFQQGEITLPPPWPRWDEAGVSKFDVRGMRRWLMEKGDNLNETDRAWAECDVVIAQLLQVDRVKGPDGLPKILGTGGMFQFNSKEKKDSAYSCVYSYFGCWLWRQLQGGDMCPGDRPNVFSAEPI